MSNLLVKTGSLALILGAQATVGCSNEPAKTAPAGQSAQTKQSLVISLSEQEVFEKVRAVTVVQLGVSEASVTRGASFANDFGADSLDMLELIMAYEEEFRTAVPDDAAPFNVVGDVVSYMLANAN